jgi:hypothetical protein
VRGLGFEFTRIVGFGFRHSLAKMELMVKDFVSFVPVPVFLAKYVGGVRVPFD